MVTGNKEAVLAALLAQRDADELERGVAEVADPQGQPQSAGSFLGDLLLAHQQAPELMRMWVELALAASRADHPAHQYFVDRYEHAWEIFADQLRAGAVGGALWEEMNAQTAAVLFVAVMDGLQAQWLLNPERRRKLILCTTGAMR